MQASSITKHRQFAVQWWRPIALAIILCWLLVQFGPEAAVDRRLSDRLLVGQGHAADDRIVLVEIGFDDVRKYGRPVIKRENHAVMINRLADLEPDRVLLDLYYAEGVDSDVDNLVAEAMARLGREKLALVTGLTRNDRPLPKFSRHATVLDAGLTPDQDGWHRSVTRGKLVGGTNPAVWLATGRIGTNTSPLDLRINQREFPRYSVDQLLNQDLDLRGKLVIVSVHPDIAPTRAFLPFSRDASRVDVLAVATQSELSGYRYTIERAEFADRILYAVAILMGLLVALGSRSGRQFIGLMIACGIMLLALNLFVVLGLGGTIYPTRVLTCMLMVANLMIAHRLRVVPMVTSFIRGDISPEEAWAWRSHEGSSIPAILFAANGTIKRYNESARSLVQRFGDSLAGHCIPRLGERAHEIALSDGAGERLPFAIDWPYEQVQIAALRDQSAIEAMERDLREQLYTDELTGCANRRGFDRQIALASAKDQGFELFYLDLNGFKQINDTFGHDAGDEMLVACAGRLQDMVRDSDVVARLGGDEFAVIMTETGSDFSVDRQIERFVATLSRPVGLTAVDEVVSVGTAVGHARPEFPGEDAGSVLRRADQAMYRDKAARKRALAADSPAKAA